jgi:hypothetical protein
MKRINLYGLFLFSTILIMNSSCSEETPSTVPSTYTAPPKDTTEPPNSTPTASAGGDIQVILPIYFFGYQEVIQITHLLITSSGKKYLDLQPMF